MCINPSFTVVKMSFIDIVDLSSDDECGDLNVKAVKLEPGIVGGRVQQKENKARLVKHQKFETQFRRQGSEENRSSNALSTGQSSSSILDQGQSPLDDTSLSSTSPICPAPVCRQFWKAGNYDDGLGSKISLQSIFLSTVTYQYLLTCMLCFAELMLALYGHLIYGSQSIVQWTTEKL
jgi:hypothetical protein